MVVVMVGVGVEEEARKHIFFLLLCILFSPYRIISSLEDKTPLILGNCERTRKRSLPLIV